MPKRKGPEKPVQGRYVKVLPPIQKKDAKRHSIGWDIPTAGKDKTSQSSPKTAPGPTTAIGRRISETTPPKVSQTPSSPRSQKDRELRFSAPLGERVSEQLEGLANKSSLPIDSTSPSNKAPNKRTSVVTDNVYLPYPMPTASPLTDPCQLELELDTKQFVRTGDMMSPWSIANSDEVQLPQLFVAANKYNGPPVVEKGQVIMVVKIKTITLVHGIHSDGKEVTLSSNSSLQMSPLGQGVKVSQSISAKALLSLKSPPPVVTVAKQFTGATNTVVPSGTRLFLQQDQASATKYKTAEPHSVLLARNLGGQEFMITASCSGIFSTHPRDTTLMLQEILKHCQLPLKVHVCNTKEEMTLESVTNQQMLVSYPFNTGQKSEATVFELPAEGSLQLVRVVMQSEEMEMSLQSGDGAEDDDVENNYEVIAEYTKTEHPQQVTSPTQKGTSLAQKVTSPTQKVTLPNVTQQKRYSVVSTSSQDRSSPQGSSVGSPPYASGASAIGTTDEYNEKKIAENLVYLKSMQGAEVLELLEAMQLEEYKESFKSEKIDGEVFSSLTEADLMHELNIQKRLHRVRLMKVIEGVYSASDILTQIYI